MAKSTLNEELFIIEEDISDFCKISGDHNDIHTGDSPIAHGALIMGKIGAFVWRKFGDGTMVTKISYLSFTRPIRPGQKFCFELREKSCKAGRRGSKEYEMEVVINLRTENGTKEAARGTFIVMVPKNNP